MLSLVVKICFPVLTTGMQNSLHGVMDFLIMCWAFFLFFISSFLFFFFFFSFLPQFLPTSLHSFFSLVSDIVWHDGWALAFRAQGGCGISVYDAWTNYSHHDDAPYGNTALEFGCLTLNGSRPCNSHFRSKYLDVWDSLNIKEVRD